MAKKKKDRDWKGGKGIKGTVRAAITHHPDKFDADCKDPGKLCPYAIFTAMKNKGFESHYKDQKSTVKGTPKKKAKFKDEDKKESDYYSFKDYCDFRESLSQGDCKYCDSRINPSTGDQIHSVDCPKYKEWYQKRTIAGRASTSG